MVNSKDNDKTCLIEMLQQVYLADNEGSSAFIALQEKVSDCLFNTMGWTGDSNNFADWQEKVNHECSQELIDAESIPLGGEEK